MDDDGVRKECACSVKIDNTFVLHFLRSYDVHSPKNDFDVRSKLWIYQNDAANLPRTHGYTYRFRSQLWVFPLLGRSSFYHIPQNQGRGYYLGWSFPLVAHWWATMQSWSSLVNIVAVVCFIQNVLFADAFVMFQPLLTTLSILKLSKEFYCCFGVSTTANFTTCSKPTRPPDFSSPALSDYWDEGDSLIRHSDHWSGQHDVFSIKKSIWTIDTLQNEAKDFLTGECNYRDFQREKKKERKKPNRRKWSETLIDLSEWIQKSVNKDIESAYTTYNNGSVTNTHA